MKNVDLQRVEASFERADCYADNAGIQRVIAAELADVIGQINLPKNANILEIGCGTGFLTRELLDRNVSGKWLITDKSAQMVTRCRSEIGEAAGRKFSVLDGDYGLGELPEQYDLICTSMAMQWFHDFEGAIARLMAQLKEGGHLVFNTLAQGTFREWRDAHSRCDRVAGTIPFLNTVEIEAIVAPFAPQSFDAKTLVERHQNAREFLRRMKCIGAATSRQGHSPLSPRALKQVMCAFDEADSSASYEVVSCHITKGSTP